MPRGGGRGNKKNYKGQRRHFTDADDLKNQAEKEARERQWRKQRGLPSDDEEEAAEEGQKSEKAEAEKDKDKDKVVKAGANGDLPPTYSDESEEDSDEEESKPKGVEHLIEVSNPNRTGAKQSKKVTELDGSGTTHLTRREREEIEKQQAKVRYQQLHAQGKTDEAQADLARLALIRRQREEQAKKKEEEKKAKDVATAEKNKMKGKS